MKKAIIGLSIIIIGGLTACKKTDVVTPATLTPLQRAVAQTQAVAVAPSAVTPGDSVYVIHTAGASDSRESIVFATLSSAITNYLTTNYGGFTAQMAFDTKDSSGTLNGYDAIFLFDAKPVGIKFDANGVFVNVLEQSEGADLLTNDWHTGGLFDGRDGLHRDTVAISAIPAAITTYFTNNYPQDTLTNAFITKAGTYEVVSQDAGLFTSTFAADGSLINRIVPPEMQGDIASIASNTLPASVATYLSATYPGYFPEDVFAISTSGTPVGYTLVINADNTEYGVEFDASGNFTAVKSLY